MHPFVLRHLLWALVALSVILLHSCTILGPDPSSVEKTYPAAGDFGAITLKALIDSDAEPGRFNVQAYVVSINECPEEYACYAPDGITLSLSRDGREKEEQYHLPAQQPRQFGVGRSYVFSIEIESGGFINPSTGKLVWRTRLLGYDIHS